MRQYLLSTFIACVANAVWAQLTFDNCDFLHWNSFTLLFYSHSDRREFCQRFKLCVCANNFIERKQQQNQERERERANKSEEWNEKKKNNNENNKHNIYALLGDCHEWYKIESNGLLHISTVFWVSAWSVVHGSKTGKYMISDSNRMIKFSYVFSWRLLLRAIGKKEVSFFSHLSSIHAIH